MMPASCPPDANGIHHPRLGGKESAGLHGDSTLGHAIVVVLGAERDERYPSVQEVLGQLGLGFDAAQPPNGPVDGDAVVFRVPHERLADVVVGLESCGFTDVRAYEGRDGHPMP
jgi:hypothetical protein